MYDPVLMKTLKFRSDRLEELMKRRSLKPGQIVYMAGISQPMISLLLADQRPNVAAVMVAKLADVLGCSVDYLVGLSDSSTPHSWDLNEIISELLHVVRDLPESRQTDLLHIAQLYAEQIRASTMNSSTGKEEEANVDTSTISALPPTEQQIYGGYITELLESIDSEEWTDVRVAINKVFRDKGIFIDPDV